MPQYIRNQNDNAAYLARRIQAIETKLNALASLQTIYITNGNSYYVLDANANAVVILGDISTAPQGVGRSNPSTVSTGLKGRGIASFASGSWVQL